MGFMIDARSIPRIRSWEDAHEWYKKTEFPCRRKEWAETPNARPLYSVRAFHKRIVKNGDDYELVLYDTPLITYHKDGTVTSIQSGTMSSSAFHWRVRPDGICYRKASGGRTLLQLNNAGSHFTEYVQGERIKVKCEDGVWKAVSGTEQRVRQYLKHKEAREATKLLKPLFLWYDASVKLGVKFGRYHFSSAPGRHDLQVLSARPDDVDLYMDFAPVLHDKPKFREHFYSALDLYEHRPIPNTEPPVRQKHWSCT